VPRDTEKVVVTLGVMRPFSVLRGAPRACGDFGDPTAVSRLNNVEEKPDHYGVSLV